MISKAKYNPFVAPEKADVINETTGEVLREAGKTYGGFMQITAPLYADPTKIVTGKQKDYI